MSNLQVPEYSSKLFTYSDFTFSICASSISRVGENFASRLYDDACDIGFGIKSSKTGKVVRFYESDHLKNGEEFVGWVFKSEEKVSGKTLKVIVFND